MRSHDDRGVSLIIVAASLLFMFGLAAIVVDGGLGFSERRQAQSAADFGVLSAAQFSNFDDLSTLCPSTMSPLARAACRGAVEADAVVDGNLGRDISWDEWDMCTDGDALPLHSQVTVGATTVTIECISFSTTSVSGTSATQAARVKVPVQDVATTFGRVLGFTELNVDAAAEVRASLPDAQRILPFAIPANAGVFECLKASPHPNWGVCDDGGSIGNYGYLDIPTYGNSDIGTTNSNCNTTNNVLLSNMIRGVDHPLGSHDTGTKSALEPGLRDANQPAADTINVCPIFGSNANEIMVQPGVVQSIFEQGMTYGFGAATRGPMWGSVSWKNGNPGNPAVDLDDTPLWDYLLPGACASGTPENTQEMIDCLNGWGGGVIFSTDIISSNRYNFAPRFWTDFTSSSFYLIRRLEPIFVNTSYWGCDASGECTGIHAPGDQPEDGIEACEPPPEPYTGNEDEDTTCAASLPLHLSTNLNAVTSFNLDRAMLPDAALDPITADGPLLDYALTR